MRRTLAVALLLALASPLRADDADELLKRAGESLAAQNVPEARALLERLVTDFPASPNAPKALARLAGTYRNEVQDEREKALEVLRRLHQKYPETLEARTTERRALELAGIHWSSLPSEVGPVQSQVAATYPGAHRRFELSRITTATYRKWLETVEVPGSRQRHELADLYAAVPRELWTPAGTVDGPSGFRSVNGQPVVEVRSVQLDLGDPPGGAYVIKETCDVFHTEHWLRVRNLSLGIRPTGPRSLVYALDPATGAPLAGVQVHARTRRGAKDLVTGPDGLAWLPTESAVVTASRGTQLLGFSLAIPECAGEKDALVLATTDRSVYRPGHVVQWKAVRRDQGAEERLSLPPAGEKVKVELHDPDGRLLETRDLAWSDAGSISGSFRIPEGEPPLGDWSIVVLVRDPDGLDEAHPFWSRTFRVLAYRKPEMRVTVAEGGPCVLGQKARATVRAEYFFGGPVPDAEVEWTARVDWESPRTRPWPRPPFDDPHAWLWRKPANEQEDEWSGGEQVAQGTGRTRADGTLEVAFDTRPGRVVARYTVQAKVRDLSRLEAEGSGTLSATPSALRVTAGATRLFHKAREAVPARVRVTTWDGKPAAGRAVEVAALLGTEVPAPPAARRAFHGGHDDAGTEFETFFQTTATTDARGLVALDVPAPERAGRLRVRARARDDAGRVADDRADLWIAGEEAAAEVPEAALAGLDVLPDRTVYEAGDAIRLMVRTSAAPLRALLTIGGAGVHEARWVELRSTCEVLELAARADLAPAVFVQLVGVKEGVVASGGTEVCVLPVRGTVDVRVEADRATYGPREKAKVKVTTTIGGKPVPAEVELAVVDESVLSIVPADARDVRRFFWRGLSRWVAFGIGVDESQPMPLASRYETERSPGLTGGMIAFSDEAKAAPEAAPAALFVDAARRLFPDTLFYAAHLKTGPDGTATVDLETADTLTTWRFTARAASGAAAFGAGASSALVRKDLSLRVSAPRFFVERDQGLVSTIVHNDHATDASVVVRLRAEGARVPEKEERLVVPAHGARRVDWTVAPAREGTVKLHAEAIASAGSDAVEVEVPVKAHGLEQEARAAGRLGAAGWKASLALPEDATREAAAVEVVVAASSLQAVRDALEYLAGYPYGCVEQTMSRLLPAIVASRARQRLGVANAALERALPDMVATGLARLYAFQHPDGGWGWWKDDATHPFQTAYVVYGLAAAKQAGFEVDKGTLERGVEHLKSLEPTPFGLAALALAGEDVGEALKEDPPADAAGRAWLVLAGRRDLAAKLAVETPADATPAAVRTAALVVRALVAADPKDARIAPLVSWLLEHRRGDAWFSTLDTAAVVHALTDAARAEKAPAVKVRVNGEDVVPGPDGRFRVGGAKVAAANAVEVTATEGGEAQVYASAVLRWRSKAEHAAARPGAFSVTRRLERAGPRAADDQEKTWEAVPAGTPVRVGDDLRVVLIVRSDADHETVMIDAPIPAGSEAREDEPDDYDWASSWYGRRELRDDRVCVAAGSVAKDVENRFTFKLRPTQPGEYHVPPAVAFAMYDPDKRGSSDELVVKVVDR